MPREGASGAKAEALDKLELVGVVFCGAALAAWLIQGMLLARLEGGGGIPWVAAVEVAGVFAFGPPGLLCLAAAGLLRVRRGRRRH